MIPGLISHWWILEMHSSTSWQSFTPSPSYPTGHSQRKLGSMFWHMANEECPYFSSKLKGPRAMVKRAHSTFSQTIVVFLEAFINVHAIQSIAEIKLGTRAHIWTLLGFLLHFSLITVSVSKSLQCHWQCWKPHDFSIFTLTNAGAFMGTVGTFVNINAFNLSVSIHDNTICKTYRTLTVRFGYIGFIGYQKCLRRSKKIKTREAIVVVSSWLWRPKNMNISYSR